MKTLQRFIIVILILFPGVQMPVKAQESKDTVTEISPTMTLVSWNTSNDTITLTANIYARKETGNFALENAEIEFTASADKDQKNLGKIKADYVGNAIVKLAISAGLPVDKEGKTTFTASFAGKGKYQPVSESVTCKKAKLIVTFTKEDSVHTIHVKAFQIEANNEVKPLPKETIGIYTPRMLSNFKLGEVALDDDGLGSIEFPGNIVGDSLGNITIYAMIEENETFGNVRGQSKVSWGIPKQYYLAERPTRELWTPVAPIWMIITLIIMLTGVWAHYVYAVIQLVMIHRQSKEKKNYF